jgi:hypothetical protein
MAGALSRLEATGSGLAPPQFRLRTLMLAITLCGVLFALMATLSALASALLLFFLSLVAAHVVGNVIGTRLRDATSGSLADDDTPRPARLALRLPVPTVRRLRERTGISRTMVVTAAIGALLGGTSGGFVLAECVGERASIAGLGLGTFSSAVLGGFCGFLLSSFLSVFSRAMTEALGEPAAAPAEGQSML